jgi:LysM repeat protein
VKTATNVNASAARPSNSRVRVSYRIQSGDTLTRIAARFKTTVRDILAWNKGLRPQRLAAGDLLTVYTRHNN